MQEKFNILSKEEKIQLLRLSVFGIEETSLTSVLDFLELGKIEKDTLLEFVYFFKSEGWITLNKERYILTDAAKEFISENYPPTVENTRYIISLFGGVLNPNLNPELDKETEILLLRVLGHVQGFSGELALLNDFYAQYLNSCKNHKSAANFFELAVEIQTKVDENDVRLCNYLNHLSETYIFLNEDDRALNIAQKSKYIADNLPQQYERIKIFTHSLLSSIYYKQEKFHTALENILRATELAEQNKIDKTQLATLYYETSIIATKTEKINDAKIYIDKAKAIVNKKMDSNKEFLEMITLQDQYVLMLDKLDKPIVKSSTMRYLFIIVFFIIVLIITLFMIF